MFMSYLPQSGLLSGGSGGGVGGKKQDTHQLKLQPQQLQLYQQHQQRRQPQIQLQHQLQHHQLQLQHVQEEGSIPVDESSLLLSSQYPISVIKGTTLASAASTPSKKQLQQLHLLQLQLQHEQEGAGGVEVADRVLRAYVIDVDDSGNTAAASITAAANNKVSASMKKDAVTVTTAITTTISADSVSTGISLSEDVAVLGEGRVVGNGSRRRIAGSCQEERGREQCSSGDKSDRRGGSQSGGRRNAYNGINSSSGRQQQSRDAGVIIDRSKTVTATVFDEALMDSQDMWGDVADYGYDGCGDGDYVCKGDNDNCTDYRGNGNGDGDNGGASGSCGVINNGDKGLVAVCVDSSNHNEDTDGDIGVEEEEEDEDDDVIPFDGVFKLDKMDKMDKMVKMDIVDERTDTEAEYNLTPGMSSRKGSAIAAVDNAANLTVSTSLVVASAVSACDPAPVTDCATNATHIDRDVDIVGIDDIDDNDADVSARLIVARRKESSLSTTGTTTTNSLDIGHGRGIGVGIGGIANQNSNNNHIRDITGGLQGGCRIEGDVIGTGDRWRSGGQHYNDVDVDVDDHVDGKGDSGGAITRQQYWGGGGVGGYDESSAYGYYDSEEGDEKN
jgi:hypothetical protein